MSGESDAMRTSVHVHIYDFNLIKDPIDPEMCYPFLSEDEKLRAARFHFERDSIRFIRSRALLRIVLAEHLGCDAKSIDFTFNDKGKPALKPNSFKELYFNLSHSGDIVSIAVCNDHRVGIDVEYIYAGIDHMAIAATYFTQEEFRFLESSPNEERIKLFFRLWVRKEAFIKAVGEGFSYPIDQLKVGDLSTLVAMPEFTASVQILGTEWISKDYEVDHAHVASVFVNCAEATYEFIEPGTLFRKFFGI